MVIRTVTGVPPSFMPGLSLCRLFYLEAVRPLLDRTYPDLLYAAARIGPGSEVLGFDSERSVDHDWGPRLELFLSADDVISHGADISALLATRLPKPILGWPTNFEPPEIIYAGRLEMFAGEMRIDMRPRSLQLDGDAYWDKDDKAEFRMFWRTWRY